jgi:hypothetical protein
MSDPRTVELITECRDALAEELSAWDIDPPLHHVKQAHDKCVAWLSDHALAQQAEPVREWQGLTEEERHRLYRRAGLEAYYPRDGVVQYEYERRLDAYTRAIEAALKEKNHG